MQFSLKSIDLRSILRDLLKIFWVIVLASVSAFLAVTGGYNLSYKPEYTSTATLAVNVKGNNGGSYSSLYLTNEMAEIFGEVFQSSALRKKIAESMGVDSFEGAISISLIEETNLMTLTVVSDTPKNAYSVIVAALENYDTVSDYLFTNANLTILKDPTVPFAPSNPKDSSRIAKLATLGAAVLSAGAIAVLSFLRPTVKNSGKAKDQLDGKIVGVIPHVKKYKTKDDVKNKLTRKQINKKSVLITSLMVGMNFVEATKKMSAVIERHMNHRKQKVLVVTSVEENEGKSSVVANIALSLAEKGNKVLLIDADLKKPAMNVIFERKIEKGCSLSDCIEGKQSLSQIIVNEKEGLYCLYQRSGVRDSGKYLSSTSFEKLVNFCRGKYDFIIIDTPPVGVSADAEILLGLGDTCAIVVREDWAEIGMINDVADVVRNSQCDFAGFVLNAFRSAEKHSGSYYGYYGKSKADYAGGERL